MSAATVSQPQRPLGLSRLVAVQLLGPAPAWNNALAREICSQLELGDVIIFPRTPIYIPQHDRQLLLAHKPARSGHHKNVAYRPAEDRITGLPSSQHAEMHEELCRVLRHYSQRCSEFLSRFLLPYSGKCTLDFASFRPLEEQGRPARLHARNDLLHFDSFPTRPTNGSRILRFFTNINPVQNRVWLTSHTFPSFGPYFARKLGLTGSFRNPLSRSLRNFARVLRFPGARRSPYDRLMHRLHNAMKEDSVFQDSAPKSRWEFPPGSSWLVCSDSVSHSVVSGQYAVEQTFLIPQSVLVDSRNSPLAILENLTGAPLAL
jgi:3-deoxy-D-manno-oct-2-ulosonic acid (Kdo) hydroxylase